MKRYGTLFLAACLGAQLAVPAAHAAGNEQLTIASLVKVARYIGGAANLTEAELARYDLDGNGEINIADLVRMAGVITGETDPKPPAPSVSDQEAMDRALELVPGAQESDIREFKISTENGQRVYEITIVYDGFEYESEMRASDGVMLKWGFEHIGRLQPGEGDIGIAQAREIALDRVPGASAANIVSLSADREDGVLVYEGVIEHSGRRYEFEIHAATGEFTEWGYEVTGTSPGPLPEPMPTATAMPPSASSGPLPDVTPTADRLLTPDEAMEKAMSYVPGASRDHFREFEQDNEHGRLVYEGEIVYSSVRYEFVLDARTGERLEWHMETRPQAGPAGVDIGEAAARQLAIAEVPGAAEADITRCKREYEDGVLVYEVKLRHNGFDYEFEIVASTGIICESRFEISNWQNLPVPSQAPRPTQVPNPPIPSAAGYISAERAREIALSQVPGAAAGNVVKCKFDIDDGVPLYEVHVWYNGRDHEFEIDAVTGVVLKHEIEARA